MSVPVVLIIGGLLLLVGAIAEGEIIVDIVKIPEFSVSARVLLGILGYLLFSFGIMMYSLEHKYKIKIVSAVLGALAVILICGVSIGGMFPSSATPLPQSPDPVEGTLVPTESMLPNAPTLVLIPTETNTPFPSPQVLPDPKKEEFLANCKPATLIGEVLEVAQEDGELTVKNNAMQRMTFRISWEGVDVGGSGYLQGADDYSFDLSPGESHSRAVVSHETAQIWAWDATSGCVDFLWFEIR